MPTQDCQRDGNPGRQFGDDGTCYTYQQGNESARNRAEALAAAQGRATEASKNVTDQKA